MSPTTRKGTLRVLVVEDTPDDFELLIRELTKGGYEPIAHRVETAEAMTEALETMVWDIVISDWSLPRFNALGALKVYKESLVDIPFIIVSGTVGDDIAVEALRQGARDFLVKGKLARLVPALARELHEAAVRRERDKMQEQLMISDRMASVGVLAAGVAHEVNNPLSAVIGYLELAIDRAKDLEEDEVLRELIDDMSAAHESATRIRDIVRDLKLFSRAGEDKRGAVDVEQTLDSTLRMASNEIRHRAKLVKNYAGVPAVDANESRLGQVFLNLIVNAAQSMNEGQADSNQLSIRTELGADEQVIVEIADTGAGMPPEVQKRLFTPFFTTKPVGVGTGLGLSICHRIVTGLGGAITVESSVDKGSVFRVSLPIARRAVEPRRRRESVIAPAVRRGRILVVDDEPMMATLVERVLVEHEVVAMTSAEDALAAIAEGARFDVLLLDLMMPEMTGMDLYAELLRVAPDQAERSIFLTGGAFTTRGQAFLATVTNVTIDKPFNVTELRAIVNELVK